MTRSSDVSDRRLRGPSIHELVDPRVRRLVADKLAVDLEDLTGEFPLVDDLAVELAIALEAEFGIVVSLGVLEPVHTYGDLVRATLALVRERQQWALIRVRIVSAGDERPGELQRAGELTPYAAETIGEDALRAGPGARLEVTVDAGTNDAGLGRVQDQFAWLGARGIQVNVHRDDRGRAPRTYPEVAA